MAIIGSFKPDKDGYAGTIRTLTFSAKVRIVANDRKGTESAPDFRVFAGNSEIGAAWRKTAKEGNTSYLSLRIDDPSFPEPMRAALLSQTEDGVLRLAWRREKREET
ncbi:DUF736 domain-containing protein [Hyphomicrobium sp. CS1BSMeth3]|uniref:DUF736 domain-containing protein n=1 Tax=Hyphomicrobium sp. CS1BSMeth3 TaxID=1892844 RepID=UPI000931A177|nr:DUF736 domain-containing protein [Hyphomicrobium sp. CS1BSMeth3]